MSFVIASPEALLAAATDLAAIRSTIRAANAAAAVPTTGALAPAADEVSAGIAALFGAQAQSYQAVSAQAAAFHDRFVQLLNAGGGSYASAEIANAQQNLLNAVNAPTQTLLGRPLVSWTRSRAKPACSPSLLSTERPARFAVLLRRLRRRDIDRS